MIEAGRKIVDAGIQLSVTLISGWWKADSILHAVESAGC